MIHYYYGYGKGKTSSAIGAGMRAYGAGLKVLLVQFFKDNKSNELSSVPFELVEAPDSLPFNPDDSYKQWIKLALNSVDHTDADVIILDEFSDLIPKYLSTTEALNILADPSKEYIITGHAFVEQLSSKADYVTRYEKVKHPYDSGIPAREGIEF